MSQIEANLRVGGSQKEEQRQKGQPQRQGRRLPSPYESFAVAGVAPLAPRVMEHHLENRQLALSSQDSRG